jgi:hypothetical protein
VLSDERPGALEQRLGSQLDAGTGFLVQQVETAAVVRNTAVHWFRKRRTEATADNVIAFPSKAVAEAA